MGNPATSQSPYKVKVEKNKTYFWCVCGLSQKQPFCDGSHKKDGIFKSLKYLAKSDEVVFFAVAKPLNTHLFVMDHILNFSTI